MASRITDSQRAMYAHLRYREGVARLAAARKAGVSNTWAVGFDRELGEDEELLASLLAGDAPIDESNSGPIPYDQLSPMALELLDDFEQWRAKVMGRRCRPWAAEAAHKTIELLASPDREYVVINCAPGLGKTTLFTTDIPAWVTCRSRTIRGVLGSIKGDLSTRYTRRLRTEFERTSPLRPGLEARERRGAIEAKYTMSQLYGRFKPLKPLVWRAEGFIVDCIEDGERSDKEFTWLGASMEEDFIGDRVEMQVWDDAATMKSSRSVETKANHFEQWNIIEDRLEPGGLLELVGQRLTSTDIYRNALDKVKATEIDVGEDDEPAAVPKYFHIKYPAHDPDKCEGYHKSDAPAWPEGCLLDPTGLPWRDLVSKQADYASYLLSYQQDDAASPDSKFKKSWIDGGIDAIDRILYPGCWDDDRDAGQLPGNLERPLSYASVDPSAAGYWVVQWFLYDRSTERRILVDMVRTKMGADGLLDLIPGTFNYRGVMEEWQVRSAELEVPIRYWILEHNSQQKWLSQYEWARQWYSTRRVTVMSHQTHASNKLDDKLGPEGALPRLFKAGLLRLPGSPSARRLLRPMVEELLHWGSYPTNDTVMALWMAEYNLPKILVQPEDDYEPPRSHRPSWMRRDGELSQAQRAMAKLLGFGVSGS